MAGDDRMIEWRVSGMDCGSCARKISDAVGGLPDVAAVDIGLMSESLRVTLRPAAEPRSAARIESVVRGLGYDLSPARQARAGGAPAAPGRDHADHDPPDHDPPDHDPPDHDQAGRHSHDDPAERGRPWWQSARGRLVILTGALLGLAWGIGLVLPDLGRWAFVLACLIGLYPLARRALAALRLGQPFTIESLMTIAATGALFIDAAEEAALVVFLFAVGEVLEGVAAGRARDGIRALSRLVPRTAWLDTGDAPLREVPAAGLVPGQVVRVRPGDRIPADGDILDGRGGVDESPVTGESVPVTRGPGDAVFAGAINGDHALRIRVTRGAADNTIARIVRLVEEAESARAPTERFIDRFSRWYMPAVVGMAILVVLVPPLGFAQPWDVWVYRGLALLLIGCPCALVISVPAAIASALAAGARRGLLLKGGAVVEAAASLRTIAFDKTGTLTLGRPGVTDLVPLGAPEPEMLAVAAAVETGSSHPLARAILEHAGQRGVVAPAADGAVAIPGAGAGATVGGQPAGVCSPRHALDLGVLDGAGQDRAAALESLGKTVVVVHRAGLALGLIALRDEPRPEAAEAMAQLRDLGLRPLMLTGDNPRTAAAIAGGLGIDHRAAMLPADKLAAIRDLDRAGGVMMVGDGINDAPALKQASVGVAMGSGTDVALETADGAILRNRVTDVPGLIRLARAAMANIRQNVAIALGLKAVFLVTSVLGLTGLWIAILADTGATVLVTLNALRLLRFDPDRAGR